MTLIGNFRVQLVDDPQTKITQEAPEVAPYLTKELLNESLVKTYYATKLLQDEELLARVRYGKLTQAELTQVIESMINELCVDLASTLLQMEELQETVCEKVTEVICGLLNERIKL